MIISYHNEFLLTIYIEIFSFTKKINTVKIKHTNSETVFDLKIKNYYLNIDQLYNYSNVEYHWTTQSEKCQSIIKLFQRIN